MSYDLAVFAAEAAPGSREAFIHWYEDQCKWSEGHSYDDPAVTTPELRSWLMEMIRPFPPMNGPLAPNEWPEDDSAAADYSIGRVMIYATFAWSQAEAAYETAFKLAAQYGLGLFDVSSDEGEIWLPNGKGGLAPAVSA